MDQQATELAEYLVSRLEEKFQEGSPSRLLVGIAGVPASGKSTFAQLLEVEINRAFTNSPRQESAVDLDPHQHLPEGTKWGHKGNASNITGSVTSYHTSTRATTNVAQDCKAILVGLDGWHYSRYQLDQFPDPKLAHDRRGSHWTFDGPSYVSFIQSLKSSAVLNIDPRSSEGIPFPTFDHSLKDPSPSPHPIQPHHLIVIIEGLYTMLSIDPWVVASSLLDERWLIQVDPDKAKERLVKRHVVTGVAKDLEEAKWRAEENDGPSKCVESMTHDPFPTAKVSPSSPSKTHGLGSIEHEVTSHHP